MSKMKPGRKPKEYSKETIYNMIHQYKEETGIIGKVKYLDMYRYNHQLYNSGKCTERYSEDFWRKKGRPGREAIDVANQLASQKLRTSYNEEVVVPNVVDAVHKFHGDKDMLIKHLKPLEAELTKSIERERKQKIKMEEYQDKYEKEKAKRKEAEELSMSLQDALFKMFRYSASDEVPLENQLKTGKTKTKRVMNALENIFNSPTEFYNMFEEKRKIQNTKVVSMEDSIRNKKTLLDDFKGKF
ncbi:hypothetical protein ACFQ3N_00600 [Virgibacillus byunsanensis]|uniref:Uncharacterized protein n=1 Tax=Virgibacillus byunsanensis TaxID=570945 RepID=A0ABW3LGI6_9BACI